MDKSAWVSKQELKDADEKLERAKDAAVKARQKWLDDVKRMTRVEGEIESIRAMLESYEAELQRLSMELSGEAHYDPEFGLSSEPKFYTEERVTGGSDARR
jgi:chromosome segregation ATPase